MQRDNEYVCNICSNTLREQRSWKRCLKSNRYICEYHCFECEYFQKDTTLCHCSLRSINNENNLRIFEYDEKYKGIYYFSTLKLVDMQREIWRLFNYGEAGNEIVYKMSRYHIEVVGESRSKVEAALLEVIKINNSLNKK